jgi:hypothetical protein
MRDGWAIASGDKMRCKLFGRTAPCSRFRVATTFLSINIKGSLAGFGKVDVKNSSFAMSHDINRPRDRQRRDGQAASHSFQHYDAKCVGPAGEYKHVGTGDVTCKLTTEFIARKNAAWIFGYQTSTVWPIADDNFAARKINFQKILDALFNRNSPCVYPDRSRQFVVERIRGIEYAGLYTARPDDNTFESALPEQALHADGWHQGTNGGTVKPAQ